MTLIKVTDGVYRSKDGEVNVSKRLAWGSKPACWQVRYANVFGSKVMKEYATLKEVKASLK